MSVDQPNTKQVSVGADVEDVPREPGAYRPAIHFGQRLRERVPDELQDRVVRECIGRGRCFGVEPPTGADAVDRVYQTFAFEREIEGCRWRVIVGIILEAYRQESVKHLALTVYDADKGGTEI